jgi:hypothetical protein
MDCRDVEVRDHGHPKIVDGAAPARPRDTSSGSRQKERPRLLLSRTSQCA